MAVDDGVELCISFILTLGVALSGTVDNEKTDDAFDGVVCFDKTGVILGVMLLLDFSLIFIGVTGTRGDGILTFDKLEDDDAISLNISLSGLTEVDNVDGADETSDNDDNFSLRDGFELELDAILGLGDGADDTSDNTGGVNTFFEDADDRINGGTNDPVSIFNSSSESESGCCFFNLNENFFFVFDGSDCDSVFLSDMIYYNSYTLI
jgi:hypothetical protein